MIMNANKFIPLALCWMALLFGWQSSSGQYTIQGSNGAVVFPGLPADGSVPNSSCTGDVFTLTRRGQNNTVSAVWADEPINLSNSFTLEAQMYFGVDTPGFADAGADGIAFVLQRDGGTGALGANGMGLGFVDLSPSVAVELDNYNNTNGAVDEGFDHMDIIYDGNIDSSAPFPGNVLFPTNIEDGAWHTVLIEWNTCSSLGEQCLTLTFDGNTIIQHCDNMIDSVFGGNPMVTWGFTSSTGSLTNNQAVCIGAFVESKVELQAVENVCIGSEANIEVVGTRVVPTSYNWSPVPNEIDSTSTVGQIATYENVQEDFLVIVEAIDSSGCTVRDTILVEVDSFPTVTTIATNHAICNTDSVIVTASSADGFAHLWYVENNGAKTLVSNSYTLTHLINNTTPTPTETILGGFSGYTFVGEAVTSWGGCSAYDTITIGGANLVASITNSLAPICEGETIQVSGAATNGFTSVNEPYTFEWSENGNILSVSNNNTISGSPNMVENNDFSYTPSTVGTSNLDLTVTDFFGCTATATVAYTVNAKPVVAINTSEDTVCVGAEVTLSAISNNATSYIWAPSTLTAASIPATIDQLGNNSFSVAVTNTNGCQDSTTIDIRGVSCCQITQNSNDYLRLDPDNIDPRLADYGIIRTLNGARNFRIINGNYHRLPEHIYLADEVTLFLNGTGATIDLTNADVVLGRNSGIYIEGGNELIANNTVFRPCDETQTWDGIVVIENDAKANFRECTFINPTFGVLYGNTTNGAVSGSLFLNAQHGIVAAGLMTGSISNNVFRVDDNAKNLTYSDPATFGFVGLNNTLSGNSNYYTNMTRYNIQHSGIFTMSTDFVQSDVIISQNEFVNAMSLGMDNPTFNGVLMTSAQGINVSNNSFTNNDMSVLVHNSLGVSVENNHMEVTRRSTSDESFYQIVTFGSNNSSGQLGSRVLIKGNTIVNSADVQDLTPNVSFILATNIQTGQQNIHTLAGTGAIYNFGNNRGKIRIEDNDIKGFEIGIYSEGSDTEVGGATQVVNNRIKANLYGIYQGDKLMFIGCNEIEMDLDANVVTDAGVVGIRADIAGHSGRGTGVAGIFGNCVRNTNRAIFMESQTVSGLGWMHIQNNYLYNYTEAGLYSENFSIVGEPTRIRRNAFISNQPNGDVSMGLGSGAFDVVTENSTIGAAFSLTLDRNYFGAKGLMNNLEIATNGGNLIPISSLVGGALKPFTSCGNMDVTSADTADFDVLIEGDWMNRCDNEDYINTTPIAQRTSTGTQLNANYQTVLTDLMGSDAPQVEGLLIGHIQSLTDLVDVEALYLTAQQLSLSTKTNNWIEYYYQERQGNHTAAQQVLNSMTTETTLEAEEVTVKKAQLDLVVRNARTLTDATLIADLKVIAGRSLGTYKHTAREILHNSTNESYTFQYNPVKLYTKPTSVGTKPQVGNNTDIRINPNPATDKITVSIIGNKSVEWTTAELYDIHGRLLLSQPVNAYTMSFDLETLAQGVYVITLKGENGYQTTEKFVKQ